MPANRRWDLIRGFKGKSLGFEGVHCVLPADREEWRVLNRRSRTLFYFITFIFRALICTTCIKNQRNGRPTPRLN